MTDRLQRLLLILWLAGGVVLAFQLLQVVVIVGRMNQSITSLASLVQQARPRQDALIAAAALRERRRDSLTQAANATSRLLLEIRCHEIRREPTHVDGVVRRCDSLLRERP